jgi:RNA polymerase sigma factor (sigma-70 family)
MFDANRQSPSMEAWRAKLDESDSQAAWDLFIERYKDLIFAAIRQLARDHDDVLDVFARVCEALRADDLARLRRYTEFVGQPARFSTWLVTVVRNQTIDWLRERDGRSRPSVPSTLSPIQKQIFEHVSNGRSHIEAYEMIRTSSASVLPFGVFLKEVNKTYRALGTSFKRMTREHIVTTPLHDIAVACEDPLPAAEARERIARALETLPAEERLAVQLFVVDAMPAADVARTVGWRNAKAVYNRVYRALAALKEAFERQGIGRGDL